MQVMLFVQDELVTGLHMCAVCLCVHYVTVNWVFSTRMVSSSEDDLITFVG